MSLASIVRDGFESLYRQSFELIRLLLGCQMGEHSQQGAVLHDQLGNHLIPPVIDDHDQQSRWASLPMEVLHDVIIRLEESDTAWPSRKHVVTCASVCKPWMAMCKEIVKSPEIHAQWLSLFSKYETKKKILKQPGPHDATVSCRIYWDKAKSTFHLLMFGHDNSFMLSAKRERRTTCTEYVIYMHAIGDDILGPSSTYMGKLSSNFLGTIFEIYEAHEPPYSTGAMISAVPGKTRSRLCSNEAVSPEVPTSGSYTIAEVVYNLHIAGFLADDKNDDQDDKEGEVQAPLIFRTTKTPTWIDKLNCWDWRGIIYGKNLIDAAAATPSQSQQPAPPPPPPPPDNTDKINISEYCRTSRDFGRRFFAMEHSYPFSTFQAFAICLSSFGTTKFSYD